MKKENFNLEKYNKKELTMTVEKVCKKGFITIIPIILIGFAIYYLIRGGYNILETPWKDYFTVMIYFIIGFVLHELIHGIVWGRVSEGGFKSADFGYDPNYAKPYCNPTEIITMKQFKIGKVMPLIITGILPYLISIIIVSFHLMIASLLLIGLCGVDIVILKMIFKEENTTLVMNHEKHYGCIVLEEL